MVRLQMNIMLLSCPRSYVHAKNRSYVHAKNVNTPFPWAISLTDPGLLTTPDKQILKVQPGDSVELSICVLRERHLSLFVHIRGFSVERKKMMPLSDCSGCPRVLAGIISLVRRSKNSQRREGYSLRYFI